MSEAIIQRAISRLTDELAQVKGDRYVEVTKNSVAEALMDCCNKSEAFAAVVADSPHTLSECMASICKGLGSSISDIELFRRAVQFYFPTANVCFDVTITMPSEAKPETSATESKQPAPSKIINIFDIL